MAEEAKLPTYETLLTEAIRSLALDTGFASSPVTAGGNSLTDATKSWAIGVHKNRLVKIIRGSGAGQIAIIDNNSANSLLIKGTWAKGLNTTSVYVILEKDLTQILRDVFGGGSDISAANPLEVHDPKVGSLVSYEGTTTADGAGDGSTLIDSVLATKPDYNGNLAIITSGAYAGQGRDINGSTSGGTVTPSSAFGGQILSGTRFVIAALRLTPTEVAAIEAKLDVQKGATGISYEQAATALSINAVNTGETDVFHLSAANTRYIVRSLRLKCADPGANTVTVRLYELANDALTEVDSFDITNANFATCHSLMDMFGLSPLAGDELQVTVRASAGGPYAITGQMSHAKTNV